MDFEKEARTLINGMFSGDALKVELYLDEISQALRKAYLSGQERMRERAGDYLGTRAQELNRKWRCGDVFRTEMYEYAASALNYAAGKVRSLPLQSNDEKELG